jgi:hypothetical protein
MKKLYFPKQKTLQRVALFTIFANLFHFQLNKKKTGGAWLNPALGKWEMEPKFKFSLG